jgi:DNA-binding ferritin-like protein
MLKELIVNREKMLPFMNEVFDSMSQSTQNLLTDMIAQYEKDIWMMKAMIK